MKDKMDRPKSDELASDLNDRSNQKLVSVDSTRRRLFGAGIAAPVILSMSSRTAWGGALCGPSAFNSMTFSSHAPQQYIDDCVAAAGRGPLFWKDNPGSWSATTYVPDDVTSTPVVVGSMSPFSSNSMSEVLSAVLSDSTANVEAHGIAALLNASSGMNLFGKTSPAAAVDLVEHLFPAFIGGVPVNLPGSTTSVSWQGGSYPMVSYFTNYLP